MNEPQDAQPLSSLPEGAPAPSVYTHHAAPAPPGLYDVPSAPFPPPVMGRRRFPRRIFAGMLLLGVLVGAGVMFGILHTTNVASSAVHIQVDTTPVQSSTNNAVSVAQQLGPAVGTIIARQASSGASLGSGFVIGHGSNVSYLLTNNHVVTGSSDLHLLMPNGNSYTATLIGADSLDDLAVVSVPDAGLPMSTFGDSSQLHVGQAVIAIGSPLGNQGSVTTGVVSALHRTISAGSQGSTSSETLQDVLQTDAPINPGNSGGPLADVEARVIGVNVAIAGNASNIGYSIPANLAREVASELIAHQPVQHPFLGIGYRDAIAAIEGGQGFNGPGVLVTSVSPNTPAAQAGFQPNDILVAVEGVNIENGETLGGLIQTKHVGDHVHFTVKRGSQTLTLTATLVERPGNL
jgi:putative serine protease PepD